MDDRYPGLNRASDKENYIFYFHLYCIFTKTTFICDCLSKSK